jgi:hypothetical protein
VGLRSSRDCQQPPCLWNLGKVKVLWKNLLGSSKEVPFMSLIPLQGGERVLFIIANNKYAIPISTCPHTWCQVLTQLHSRPFWHKQDFNFASPLMCPARPNAIVTLDWCMLRSRFHTQILHADIGNRNIWCYNISIYKRIWSGGRLLKKLIIMKHRGPKVHEFCSST